MKIIHVPVIKEWLVLKLKMYEEIPDPCNISYKTLKKNSDCRKSNRNSEKNKKVKKICNLRIINITFFQ